MASENSQIASGVEGHSLDRLVRTFVLRAKVNLDKWGEQDFETLGLAIAEESGELCQAILKSRHEGGSPERIRQEAIDLGALCVQVLAHWPNAQDHGHLPAKGNDE
jgi:NTP pyrophosphatase (non-canonical NTP hydrolase)